MILPLFLFLINTPFFKKSVSNILPLIYVDTIQIARQFGCEKTDRKYFRPCVEECGRTIWNNNTGCVCI
jgi:hypothetical protein